MSSVLKEWVTQLPLREQGTLLTAVRGCDLTPKEPLDSPERRLTAFVRCAIMHPFDAREIDSEAGCFMQTKIPAKFKGSSLGHYPLHYVMHLLHAMQIIGYRSPETEFQQQALSVYLELVRSFHLNAETFEQMITRLGEDRIAGKCIVD